MGVTPFLFLASAHVPYRTAPPNPLSMNAIHQIYPPETFDGPRHPSSDYIQAWSKGLPAGDATLQMHSALISRYANQSSITRNPHTAPISTSPVFVQAPIITTRANIPPKANK